jgi:hypothetical protein
MIAEVISAQDPRWRETLRTVQHDFYHLPEYIELCARYEGGEPCAVFVEDEGAHLLAPLLLRSLPEPLRAPADWRDASTPYGYPTPLVTDSSRTERLFEGLGTALKDVGAISIFARLHPLLRLSDGILLHGTLVHHGPTVAVDVSADDEQLWRQTRNNHRSGINKLRRLGFIVAIDDWSRYGDFQAIYLNTMNRVGASGFYQFDSHYFEELRGALGDSVHLLVVTDSSGEVSAGGLFTVIGDIAQYHLGGTSPDFLPQAPSKLMFHEARRWARDAGAKWLHLGGGLGATEDALYHFKRGFSEHQFEFWTFRSVLDLSRYRELNDRWIMRHGHAPGDEFFPAYRAPV